MIISYVVETEKDALIKTWFVGLDKRLRARKGVLFEGAAHNVGPDGLYAVAVDIILLPLLIGAYMLMFGGVAAWILFGSVGWSNWLTGVGAGLATIVYVLISPGLHVLLMRRTLKRLTGKDVKVRLATKEAVRRLAYGEV